MTQTHPAAVCIIGAGPRGTSILERLRANAPAWAETTPWDVYVVDEFPFGAGKVWRTEQPRELCMNTFAGAVTNFTDSSVDTVGPISEGPSLFEWCALLLHEIEPGERTAALVGAIPPAHRYRFHEHPVRKGVSASYLEELRELRPESHPSRALYGEYLVWCYERARADLPACAILHEHRARATGIQRLNNGRERIQLSDGVSIDADAVVFAGGWLARSATRADQDLARGMTARLTWVRPDSPIEQDLSGVPSSTPVIVRGLGMGFFDTISLLTIGRGGRFEPLDDGTLSYLPSGDEPIVYATSHRGVPFLSKSVYGSLPPRAAHRYLRAVRWGEPGAALDFARDVWPAIVRDAYEEYYRTLARESPEAFVGELDAVLNVIEHSQGSVSELTDAISPFIVSARRFDLNRIISPLPGPFASREAFDDWVLSSMADDLTEAEAGVHSPIKSALWSVGAARGEVARRLAFGRLHADSFFTAYRDFLSLGGMVGSGPPAFRTRQLIALQRAGLVHFIGPAADLTIDDETGLFIAASPMVAGSRVLADTLIDAWMHMHDVSASTDGIVTELTTIGRMRSHAIDSLDGTPRRTSSIDIDAESSRIVGADGVLDAAVHVIGIPVDASRGDTIISPMPGANSMMLCETDRVAVSVLEILSAKLLDDDCVALESDPQHVDARKEAFL
ncbi:MAG: FAD/NAD(P)-binding protein [Rhodoglobus sp.]